MQRRHFLQAGLAAVIPARAVLASQPVRSPIEILPTAFPAPPQTIAGLGLQELVNDYHDRLFNRYLPFWDKGGCDRQFGGVMCELNDDGTVADDAKFIWYQGRGIWVYSFLYNQFGRDPRWLEVARKTRDFMVKHMYAGDGRWNEKVRRDGTLLEGIGPNVYGWLFAAAGLAEYSLASAREEDLNLAKESILAAAKAYDDPGYVDTHTTRYTGLDIPSAGLRSQGHSMVLVNVLSPLLSRHQDPQLEGLLHEHVDNIVHKFWNPDYGIQNEYLAHDYSRLSGAAGHMLAGHSMETLWMVMHEALRIKDRTLLNTCKDRVRRLVEMCWDYVFEGWGDGNFSVFGDAKRPRGPDFDVKTMWAHCEAMVACLSVLEHTGEIWAKEWYERLRAYTLRTMPVREHGVWRQAVDRYGKDMQRVGVSTKRKDNFHQARYMMLDMLSLQRILANGGRTTPIG